MVAPRTAKQVIDQLIKENRWWEWFCFIAVCVFLLVGVGVIVRAMIVDQSNVLTVVGGTCNVLIGPALTHARRIRKENQAMRLLEIPLSKAETAEKAANMIREMFVEVFVHQKG
jgi:hypothetical protein